MHDFSFSIWKIFAAKKLQNFLFYFEPVQLLMVLLKFRIRTYSRMPNYSELAIPSWTFFCKTVYP